MRRSTRLLTTAATVGIMLILATAAAADEVDFARPGPYAGLGFALGLENFDESAGDLDHDPAYGFDVWAGYRFARFASAELQLEYLNGFKTTDVAVGERKFQGVTFTGNVKGYIPAGRVQPFGVIGIGGIWEQFKNDAAAVSEVSDTAFAARFGGGLDVYLTESLALDFTASYVLATGDLDGGDYVSLIFGTQLRF